MKTKTQIVFTTSVLAGFIGILLIAIRLPQKEKEQGVWVNNWDIALWAVVGIGILALIAFGLRKFGTSPISWFPSWLKGLIAIAVIVGAGLWIYREWGSLEKGLWSVKGFADKAIVEEVTLSSVEGIELDGKQFDSASTRYFRVRILPDKDTYWGTCSDGEIFEGIAVQNERIRKRFSRSADLSDGNIVIHGDGGTPSRDGELIQILQGSKPRVSLEIQKRNHPGCKTDAPLRANIQFIPETP